MFGVPATSVRPDTARRLLRPPLQEGRAAVLSAATVGRAAAAGVPPLRLVGHLAEPHGRAPAAMRCFGRSLYDSLRPYRDFTETINAVYHDRTLRRLLAPAWDLAGLWRAMEPPEHRMAMPRLALVAMVSLALAWGWPRFASSGPSSSSALSGPAVAVPGPSTARGAGVASHPGAKDAVPSCSPSAGPMRRILGGLSLLEAPCTSPSRRPRGCGRPRARRIARVGTRSASPWRCRQLARRRGYDVLHLDSGLRPLLQRRARWRRVCPPSRPLCAGGLAGGAHDEPAGGFEVLLQTAAALLPKHLEAAHSLLTRGVAPCVWWRAMRANDMCRPNAGLTRPA